MEPVTTSTEFQTNVMIDKLKKIRKKKEETQKDTPPVSKLGTENLEPLVNSSTERVRWFDESTDESTDKSKVESFRGFPGFQKSSGDMMTGTGIADFSDPTIWEGIDNVNDEGNDESSYTDPRQILVDAINYIYNEIEKGKQMISYYICIYGGKYEDTNPMTNPSLQEDIILIKNNVSWLLTILASYLVLYNILFITFYEENERKPLFLQLFPDNVRPVWDNSFTHFFGLSLIVKIAFVFTTSITSSFLNFYPRIIKSWIQAPFLYVLLYFCVVQVIYYWAYALKQHLIDIIMLNFTLFTIITHFTIIFSFFMDESQIYMIPSKTVKAAENGNPVSLFLRIFQIYRNFSNPISIIIYLICLIIHFMITMMICPFLSAFFIVFYLIYLFFLPILSCIMHDVGFEMGEYYKEYKKVIEKMDKYFSFEIDEPTLCDPETWLGMIRRFFLICFNFFQQHLLYFVLFYILFQTGTDYYSNIRNDSLKRNVLFFNGFFALCISFWLISKFMYKYILSQTERKRESAKLDGQIDTLMFGTEGETI